MNTNKGKANQSAIQKVEEPQQSNKPLTTTLLQEFQNLKDKFKNEDDTQEKESPYKHLEKATVLQECRVFHDSSVVTQNPRKCSILITKLLFLLVKGESFTSSEVTEVFFGVTKLFQSDDVNLRRMMYLFIKEIAETCNPDDVIIVTSSLTKDMNTGEDLYRANSMRVLAKIIDSTMLGAIERYLKQAIVDKNAFVASSALMSGLRLFSSCPDVVRRWINEVQEAVNSSSDMVQYQSLSLLYKIKQHDRLAVSKIVQQLSKGSLRSPLATCLLVRYTSNLLIEDLNSTSASASYQFLQSCLRHKNDMVIFEAAKAICNLPNVEANDLTPAINVLQLFLSSPKPTLRFAAMRTLSDVAVKHPVSVTKCNDDMEALVSDTNRSIATLAITTLLKTGNESSIDRLMKQINTFMNEISDEFKIIIVKAIRELCIKYQQKHRVLVGFLATFLREEGGFEFKKSIVDSIIDLMNIISDTKESSLLHLCEFIEDCEYDELIVQILYLIGNTSHLTSSPSRYIRFVFNRIILENSIVRAAAVSTLGLLSVRLPELRPHLIILIKRSLSDEDDEVRDRASLLVNIFNLNLNDNDLKYLLDEKLNYNYSVLEKSIKSYLEYPNLSDTNITFSNLPIVEESYVPPANTTVRNTKKSKANSLDNVIDNEPIDPASALYKIPQFTSYGRVFRSSNEIPLTENEMEYVVTVIKHIFTDHIVLQFNILNTIDDQQLRDVIVNIDLNDSSNYEIDHVIPASIVRYGESNSCYVSLKSIDKSTLSATISCELHFKVIQVNPNTGEVEGNEDGYDENYPLENLDILVNDYMSKVSIVDFRKSWETIGNANEVLEKFGLPFKKLEEASTAVIDYLGMLPVDGTGTISTSDESSKKGIHTIHLSGIFIGNVQVLVRAMLQLDEKVGVVLKIGVRSNDETISRLVADCIN